jgi:hypothetical protein
MIADAAIENLRGRVRGRIIRAGDQVYPVDREAYLTQGGAPWHSCS